ncbi:hypothetical protein [Ottowia sp.]|uniref:hypothetical protein n=1 Tax=Ottowia sp. TaxID=1898956 RepID=UPI003A8B977A
MRSLALVILLIVLVVMGWLNSRQVAFVPRPVQVPGAASAPAAANVAEQSRQIQQQVKQQLDTAMQTPRDVPDDIK